MTTDYFPPHLRCLYEELADHSVDEIWEAMNHLGILEEFLDAALETEKDDPPPAPVVADPKLITHLIGSGTKVPPPYPSSS